MLLGSISWVKTWELSFELYPVSRSSHFKKLENAILPGFFNILS
jgi:hypothetical protein